MVFSKGVLTIAIVFIFISGFSQGRINWLKDGSSYTRVEAGEIVKYTLPANTKSVVLGRDKLIPSGQTKPLLIRSYSFSDDGKKILIYTNSKRVWRLDTRGDYWVFDFAGNSLTQVGKGRPSSSLMFAKFSPDGSKVGYVSEYNLYVDDLAS